MQIWSELDEVGQSDDENEEDDDGGEGEEAGEDEAGGEDGEGEEGEEKDIGDDATMKAFMKMFLGKCLTTRHSAGKSGQEISCEVYVVVLVLRRRQMFSHM